MTRLCNVVVEHYWKSVVTAIPPISELGLPLDTEYADETVVSDFLS